MSERIINGVSDSDADFVARMADGDIATMLRKDRERFFDVAARLQDTIDRAVAVDGEGVRASAERVAAATLRVIFGQPGDDEPGARLGPNTPGAFRVRTHSRQAPSLRQVITQNRERNEAQNRQNLSEAEAYKLMLQTKMELGTEAEQMQAGIELQMFFERQRPTNTGALVVEGTMKSRGFSLNLILTVPQPITARRRSASTPLVIG
ncbi:hypothetical protein [Mycobacterium kubicae]|uniref:hypothetical protein n=1 Tax=Mycobacterium kubicae TaxID=120959 RepID=UPI000A8F8697|nr:hypothetical protein [Mycobacterium kubicae]